MVYSLIDHRNDVKVSSELQSFELLMSFLWSIFVPTMKNCRFFFSVTPTAISGDVSWEIIFIYLLLLFFQQRGTLMAAAILKAMSKMEAIVSSFALQNTPALQFTIGDKIVETLSSNGITSKNKTIRTPPPSRPLKVRVFLVFNR